MRNKGRFFWGPTPLKISGITPKGQKKRLFTDLTLQVFLLTLYNDDDGKKSQCSKGKVSFRVCLYYIIRTKLLLINILIIISFSLFSSLTPVSCVCVCTLIPTTFIICWKQTVDINLFQDKHNICMKRCVGGADVEDGCGQYRTLETNKNVWEEISEEVRETICFQDM